MNLTIIVGQRTLSGMETETCQGTKQEAPDAPLDIGEGDVLRPQADDDA